jgi:hypothetical protein
VLVYFTAITNILEPFEKFYGIWYTSGMLYQEKFGNPDLESIRLNGHSKLRV